MHEQYFRFYYIEYVSNFSMQRITYDSSMGQKYLSVYKMLFGLPLCYCINETSCTKYQQFKQSPPNPNQPITFPQKRIKIRNRQSRNPFIRFWPVAGLAAHNVPASAVGISAHHAKILTAA